MKKFDIVKKEFLDFLEFDKGYSERTIENYDRDISKFEVYITEFSINYKKLSKDDTTIEHALQQKAKDHSEEGFWKAYDRLRE